jgi:hypothetical protein
MCKYFNTMCPLKKLNKKSRKTIPLNKGIGNFYLTFPSNSNSFSSAFSSDAFSQSSATFQSLSPSLWSFIFVCLRFSFSLSTASSTFPSISTASSVLPLNSPLLFFHAFLSFSPAPSVIPQYSLYRFFRQILPCATVCTVRILDGRYVNDIRLLCVPLLGFNFSPVLPSRKQLSFVTHPRNIS